MIVYYITKVKSKAMSKKIIRIRERIKKSFLCISSASFHMKVGKHSTANIFSRQIILKYLLNFDNLVNTLAYCQKQYAKDKGDFIWDS